MPDNIINMVQVKPKLPKRKRIIERRIIQKTQDFAEMHISGVSDEAVHELQPVVARIYPMGGKAETPGG